MAVERIKGDKGFLFYYDDQIFLEYLEPADFKTVVLSACVYAKTGNVSMPEDSSKESMMAFRMMASHIDRDKEKYAEISRKRAEAGSAGGLAKATNAKQGLANLAFATNDNQNKANLPDKDKDKDKDKEKDKDKDKDIETEANNWAVFIGIINGNIPESKFQNPEKCRELLETRIEETGLTAEELGNCFWKFTSDYQKSDTFAESRWQYFPQVEKALEERYTETLKPYVTEKVRAKKAQQKQAEEEHINLWDDDEEDSL